MSCPTSGAITAVPKPWLFPSVHLSFCHLLPSSSAAVLMFMSKFPCGAQVEAIIGALPMVKPWAGGVWWLVLCCIFFTLYLLTWQKLYMWSTWCFVVTQYTNFMASSFQLLLSSSLHLDVYQPTVKSFSLSSVPSVQCSLISTWQEETLEGGELLMHLSPKGSISMVLITWKTSFAWRAVKLCC